MKLTTVATRLEGAPLCCPLCGDALKTREGRSLACGQGHCYDLSKKGYVNLAPQRDQKGEKYDAALFAARERVFADGFYEPVLDAIARELPAQERFTMVDVGCGEGYYTRALERRFPRARMIGVDLSRDAICAAAKGTENVAWLVADLKRLPFLDQSVDVLLDVLTPADYAEFGRVLRPEGKLIKVVPGERYLQELRQALGGRLQSGAYSNERVLAHLKEHVTVLHTSTVEKTYALSQEQSAAFVRMTPMTFGVEEEALGQIQLSRITLHLQVLCCFASRPLLDKEDTSFYNDHGF